MERIDIIRGSAPGVDMQGRTTRDGRFIQLMLLDPRPYWTPLCELLGLAELSDDPRFAENVDRLKNAAELVALIGGRIAEHDWAHWDPIFTAWNAPWELIRTIAELHDDPQVLANEMIYTVSMGGEPLKLVAGPAGFDGRAAPVDPKPSPSLGEHTDELLLGVGYSKDQLAQLKSSKAAQ